MGEGAGIENTRERGRRKGCSDVTVRWTEMKKRKVRRGGTRKRNYTRV